MSTEQPFTESEREVIAEVIDRRMQEEMAPAVDKAFDVGGVSALRSAAHGFSLIPDEFFTKVEVITALARMEQAIDPTGEARQIVDRMEANAP